MAQKMADAIFLGEEAREAPRIFAERFGMSIFTTMAAPNGRIQLWPRHYGRLRQQGKILGLSIPSEQHLLDEIRPCLKNLASQKVRILIGRQNFALSFEDLSPPPPEIYRGVSVHFSSLEVDECLKRIKSTTRTIYERALQEARARQCFEAILLDKNGYMVDGARTSLLIFDGCKTFLGPMGGMEGVMRAEIMALLQREGFYVKKCLVKPKAVRGQLLLCNSLLGVVPVGDDNHPLVAEVIRRARLLTHG